MNLQVKATRVIFTDVNGHQAASYSVELAGSDAMHDLAVLRITPTADDVGTETISGLEPIQIGRSSELKVRGNRCRPCSSVFLQHQTCA